MNACPLDCTTVAGNGEVGYMGDLSVSSRFVPSLCIFSLHFLLA